MVKSVLRHKEARSTNLLGFFMAVLIWQVP